MRIYDPRVGKFLSTDPITKQYPELTPYQFASNSPIEAVDLDGLERSPAGKFGQYNEIVRDNTAVQLYPNAIPVIQKQKEDAPKLRMLKDLSSRLPETLEDAGKAAFRSNLSNADNIGGQAAFGIYQNIHDAKAAYKEGDWVRGTLHAANAAINTGTLIGAGEALGVKGKVDVPSRPAAGVILAEMEASIPGAHFFSRHGAETSLSSQYKRAISGLTPDGQVLKTENSSRFLTNGLQLEAVKKAESRFSKTGETSFRFNMGATVGEGYLKGGGAGSYRTSNEVQAVFKNGNLNTLYPRLTK